MAQPYSRKSRLSPSCIFVTVTLLVTSASSGLLILAIFTDHWEYIDFKPEKVKSIVQNSNNTESMKMIIDNRVAQLFLRSPVSTKKRSNKFLPTTEAPVTTVRAKRETSVAFLVPMHGGVWSICTDLTDKQRDELAALGYGQSHCQEYMSSEFLSEGPNDWMTRMQNLSISCAIVCLIILGTAVLLGLFGICKRQISAVLVTGVMYILAAAFCIFSLAIMHFKRKTSKDCGLVDRMIPEEFQHAQFIKMGWSLAIGWVGVTVCTITAILWYLLSKIMRYGPITLT